MGVPPDQMQQQPGLMSPPEDDPFAPQSAEDPEREVFETIVAGLREHIFGKGEAGISKRLSQSEDLVQVIAELTFVLCNEAIQQGKENGAPVDADLMIAVATYVIDDLLELAEALELESDLDPDTIREGALHGAVLLYVNSNEISDEEREEAKMMLADMQGEGMVDEAASRVQQLGAKVGMDPFAPAAPPDEPPADDGRPVMMGG